MKWISKIKPSSKVLILDGNNFSWRIVYSLSPPYLDKDIFEVIIKSFLFLFWKFLPDYVFIVWDGIPSHKLEMLPTYKSKRKEIREKNSYMQETWEFLHAKIPMLKDFLHAFGGMSYELGDGETDDFIAAFCFQLKKHAISSVVVSTDRDYLHLLPYSSLLFPKPKQNDIYGETLQDYPFLVKNLYKFTKDYEFPFEGHLLFQSLIGDSSDSVRGYTGIGPQTAAKGICQLVSCLGKDFKNKCKNVQELIDAITSFSVFSQKHIDKMIKDEFSILKFNYQFFNPQFWVDKYAFQLSTDMPFTFDLNPQLLQDKDISAVDKDVIKLLRKNQEKLLTLC